MFMPAITSETHFQWTVYGKSTAFMSYFYSFPFEHITFILPHSPLHNTDEQFSIVVIHTQKTQLNTLTGGKHPHHQRENWCLECIYCIWITFTKIMSAFGEYSVSVYMSIPPLLQSRAWTVVFVSHWIPWTAGQYWMCPFQSQYGFQSMAHLTT